MPSRRISLTSRHSGFYQLDDKVNDEMTRTDGRPQNVDDSLQDSSGTGDFAPPYGAEGLAHSTSRSYPQNENEKAEGVSQPAAFNGKRQAAKLQRDDRRSTGGSEEVHVNALGRLYARIVGFSVVTRYLVYILPVGILLAVPIVVLAFTDNKNKIFLGYEETTDPEGKVTSRQDGPPLFLLFLWIEITWLSLWAAKLVAWVLPKVFMFVCGIVSMGVRKYATILKNLTITLSLLFWALGTWLTFKNLFLKSINANISWSVDLERVLAALFISSAVLLFEKALVQLIGVSYHQRSFANRIKASKREIRLLGLLYDASRKMFPMYCPDFAEEDYIIDDSIEMMLRSKKKRIIGGTGSATPMKIIGNVGRLGNKVTSVVGHVAHEITGKQVFNPNSAHSIVLEALEKKLPSEALARRIWMSFAADGETALFLRDLEQVLSEVTTNWKDEAEAAFDMLDSDLNGDVSLEETVLKVIEIGKERKAISEGMKDIGQALRVFDKVLVFVVLIITIFIFLFVFQSNLWTKAATAGTALLSLSFVFAVTTQEFLGSCIFLFVKHPYDVGDRVEIGDVQMLVERISLLYTVFTKTARNQITQVPNIVLNGLWIDNISRSKAMTETIKVDVSYDTSFEDIELLRMEMESFVRHTDNARDFKPDFTIAVAGVNNLDKLTLEMSIQHKSNWHNGAIRATRRSKFMCALALALKKIPIYPPGGGSEVLGGPTNPTYSVAVTDQWASKSRAEAAKKAAASRLVPVDVEQTEEEAQAAEEHAAANINEKTLAAERSGNWDGHETASIMSRSASAAGRRRSRDIESVRNELYKKESRSGRRKPGEGPQTLAPPTGVSTGYANTSDREGFDPEAQTVHPQRGYSFNQRKRTPTVPEDYEEGIPLKPFPTTQSTWKSGGPDVARGPSRGPPSGQR